MRLRALSRSLTCHGSLSVTMTDLGHHLIHSKTTTTTIRNTTNNNDSMLRENQVSSTAILSFLQGMALGSSQRPDIHSWKCTENHLLETVHGMMKNQMTRPSLMQPVVKASYTMAGLVVGRVARPDIRDAIVHGLYDSVQDSATDQLRTLYEKDSIEGKEEMRTLIKTLRDKREDLVPQGPGSHDTEMVFRILSSLNEEKDDRPTITAPEVAATLTKHMTSLFTHIAKQL